MEWTQIFTSVVFKADFIGKRLDRHNILHGRRRRCLSVHLRSDHLLAYLPTHQYHPDPEVFSLKSYSSELVAYKICLPIIAWTTKMLRVFILVHNHDGGEEKNSFSYALIVV